jgi:hypothetical protein
MRHLLHAGLANVINIILKDAGVLEATIVMEAKGLRAIDTSIPGDVVALDFFANGRCLVIDAVVTSIYTNRMLHQVANIPGYAAKKAEDRKILADRSSRHLIAVPHGGSHVMVRFAIEDGVGLGAHAQALLRAMSTFLLVKRRIPPATRRLEDAPHSKLVSMWVRQWQYLLSAWLHLTLYRMAIRILCPTTTLGLQYI